MFSKLNSSLQTRNILGISFVDLENLDLDPHFYYLKDKGGVVAFERGGNIQVIPVTPLSVQRGRAAVLELNPELHHLGTVSCNTLLTGEVLPDIIIKGYKGGETSLDWFYKLRLVNG